jgi:hypothetical protein
MVTTAQAALAGELQYDGNRRTKTVSWGTIVYGYGSKNRLIKKDGNMKKWPLLLFGTILPMYQILD